MIDETSYPGPSPVWLGLFAGISFLGLVATSFASGYHLVGATPQAAPAETSGPADGDPKGGKPAATPAGARSGVIRKHDNHDSAVVRASPRSGDVVDQLPPDHSVTVIGREGDWFQVRYDREGDTRTGWTHEVNLALE